MFSERYLSLSLQQKHFFLLKSYFSQQCFSCLPQSLLLQVKLSFQNQHPLLQQILSLLRQRSSCCQPPLLLHRHSSLQKRHSSCCQTLSRPEPLLSPVSSSRSTPAHQCVRT